MNGFQDFISENWQFFIGIILPALVTALAGYYFGVRRDRKKTELERSSKQREKQLKILENLWEKILIVDEKMAAMTSKVLRIPALDVITDEALPEFLGDFGLLKLEIDQILALPRAERQQFFTQNRTGYFHSMASRAYVELNNYYHEKRVTLGQLSTIRDKLNAILEAYEEILKIDDSWNRAIATRSPRSEIEEAYDRRETKFKEARQLLEDIDTEISKLS